MNCKQEDHRSDRSDFGADEIDSSRPCRTERSASPDRFVYLPRPDRRRQDRVGARAGGVPVRKRRCAGANRYVRIHGEVRRQPSDRSASGIRRLRRGRTAHRESAPSPLFSRAAGRNRESASGCFQHPVAASRRRQSDRLVRTQGRFPQHGDHHDVQRRHA